MVFWIWMLMFSCWTPRSYPSPDAPNIILISLDTVRMDRLTAYGYERPTTPFLKSLADKGVRFTNSYSQAPRTSPSHATMFSGELAHEHQVYAASNKLSWRTDTIAELLYRAGYATFATGTSRRFVPETGFNQGFEVYKDAWTPTKNERSAAAIEHFERFLTTRSSELKNRPLFAFIHLFDAHAPYSPPNAHAARFTKLRPDLLPSETIQFIQTHHYEHQVVAPDKLRYLQDLYDGGLTYLDLQLERLLNDRKLPNDRPTVIIITSDHGEAFKEHGYLGHGKFLYEELMRVPLIMVWEGHIPPGTTREDVAQNVDLYSTILEFSGLPLPKDTFSRSLVAVATGSADSLAQPYPGFTDVQVYNQLTEHWAIAATMDGYRFKLTRKGEAYTLFNLTEDPGEKKEVYTKFPETASALIALARTVGLPFGDAPAPRADQRREVSEEELEALRAIGYVDEEELR